MVAARGEAGGRWMTSDARPSRRSCAGTALGERAGQPLDMPRSTGDAG